MKRINKKLTEAEKEQKAEQATYNRRRAGFKRTILSLCESMSLRTVELQLEFLEGHPQTKLPREYFTYDDTLNVYREGIAAYRERLAGGYYSEQNK